MLAFSSLQHHRISRQNFRNYRWWFVPSWLTLVWLLHPLLQKFHQVYSTRAPCFLDSLTSPPPCFFLPPLASIVLLNHKQASKDLISTHQLFQLLLFFLSPSLRFWHRWVYFQLWEAFSFYYFDTVSVLTSEKFYFLWQWRWHKGQKYHVLYLQTARPYCLLTCT